MFYNIPVDCWVLIGNNLHSEPKSFFSFSSMNKVIRTEPRILSQFFKLQAKEWLTNLDARLDYIIIPDIIHINRILLRSNHPMFKYVKQEGQEMKIFGELIPTDRIPYDFKICLYYCDISI